MGFEASNLQGANIRQVVTQGDQVAQIQATRKDANEFQSRLGGALVEKSIQSRDQATGGSDLVAHRQEDDAKFTAGDDLNGGPGGGPAGGEEDPGTPESHASHPSETAPPPLETLPDPFEVAARFGLDLIKLGKDAPALVFRSMDRRLLAGLSKPDTATKVAETYRQQTILTGGAADTVRMTLEAALREALTLSGNGGDLDHLRKLLSLVRQGCRSEPGPGRDLSSLASHMLVRISREEPGALFEALGILSHVVGSIRDWRAENSRGMLPKWAMR